VQVVKPKDEHRHMGMSVNVCRNRHFDLPANPRGNQLRNSRFQEHYKKYGVCLAQIISIWRLRGDILRIYHWTKRCDEISGFRKHAINVHKFAATRPCHGHKKVVEVVLLSFFLVTCREERLGICDYAALSFVDFPGPRGTDFKRVPTPARFRCLYLRFAPYTRPVWGVIFSNVRKLAAVGSFLLKHNAEFVLISSQVWPILPRGEPTRSREAPPGWMLR